MTTEGPNLQDPQDARLAELLRENELLRAERQHLLDQQREHTRTIEQLQHQLQGLLKRLFGRSAEKVDPKQMMLFQALLDQLAPATPEPAAAEPAPVQPVWKGHGRRRLPADLPRQKILHDLPEEEKPCPCCGAMRHVIGQEIDETLDYVPAKLTVIQNVRLKYACPNCQEHVAIAEKPPAPIEKGLAAPGLLAYVLVSKYSDHLPLHRLERILQRHGIDIARSTMCDWAASCAGLLRPLYERMISQVLVSKVIHTDDTPVDVLDRQRPWTRTGRFWVYLGDAEQAITYALNQWEALCVYTTDGHLAIDNNASENALRRVAIGRKNWLFCGSDNGGTTAAVLFSLIATCQRHQVEPFEYLQDVLTRLPASPLGQLDAFLPDRWQAVRTSSIPA